MPTMQDIADRVGVHQATVSNVLNGKLRATRSDAARRATEIRRVAKEMGYRPSVAARATRTGRTGFVGMLRSPVMGCSVLDLAFDRGVEQSLHSRGLCLVRDIVDDISEGRSPSVLAPRIVRENMVDGLLVNYAFGTPPVVRDLLDRCNVPAVWINRKRESNCVRPNDEGAAIEATGYLLSQGHRRITYVDGSVYGVATDRDVHYSIGDRRAGYEQVMRQAGLTPDFYEVPVCEDTRQIMGRLLAELTAMLRLGDLPTAVLCGNGSGRVMLLAAAHAGLRVPEDLSVMTFDNDAGAISSIAVDHVLVPYFAMGRAAVEEVCALIARPDQPRRPVVLPFEFLRAGTVARPKDLSSDAKPFSPLSLQEDSR
ncbi:MAG: LacI family DNA-binding transcriptional regulator [Phycisphaerales bacterium]